MRIIFTFTLFLFLPFTALADETITIYVKESNYLTSNSKAKLTFAELEGKLKTLNISTVILDVDYCAGPQALANAYLAIANAKPMLKDIKLNLSGSHKKGMCKST
ncbi:hypothetical protein [uncultured Pseudoalteromonas sp.]|uniref:hypothetical protein n=1 Tax=uncultured Pseudoalteromonas sp. TaxID=114053 RepID=UPI0030C876D1